MTLVVLKLPELLTTFSQSDKEESSGTSPISSHSVIHVTIVKVERNLMESQQIQGLQSEGEGGLSILKTILLGPLWSQLFFKALNSRGSHEGLGLGY